MTAFLGFLTGWTEFYFVWMFLQDPRRTSRWRWPSTAWSAQFGQTPWSQFAAFSILFALPVSLVFFVFQKYLVTGLAIGGVKG